MVIVQGFHFSQIAQGMSFVAQSVVAQRQHILTVYLIL